MVSLILEKVLTVPVSLIFFKWLRVTFEAPCERWKSPGGEYFFFILLYGTKEPFYNLLGLFGILEFGESLAKFFLRIHLTWVYFESASWRSFNRARSHHQFPFCFKGLASVLNVLWESTFRKFRNSLELNCEEWRIIEMIFLAPSGSQHYAL